MKTEAQGQRTFQRWVAAGIGTACLALMTAGAPAAAGGETEPLVEKYAINLDDRQGTADTLLEAPLPLSIELDGMIVKRDLDFDNLSVTSSEMRRLGLALGIDITPWFTLRGLIGSSDFKSNAGGVGSLDAGLATGISAEYRLLNRRIEPRVSNISWIRCDASARYFGGIAESGDDKVEWREGYADMTLSLVTTPPDPFREVNSLTLFLGPAVSWIDGTLDTAQGGEYQFSHDRLVGFTGGFILAPNDTIKVKLLAQVFGDVSYEAAVQLHF